MDSYCFDTKNPRSADIMRLAGPRGYQLPYCTPVSPEEFYRAIFPDGTLDEQRNRGDAEEKHINEPGWHAYYGVVLSLPQGEQEKTAVIQRFITDEMSVIDEIVNGQLGHERFCYAAPVTYAGRRTNTESARYVFGIVVDVDDLLPNGLNFLCAMWKQGQIPTPSYIVASGRGVHLYFLFAVPLPAYRNYLEQIRRYKYYLIRRIWNDKVTAKYEKPEYQSPIQKYRVPGSMTKDGAICQAFQVGNGHKYTVDELNAFLPPRHVDKQLPSIAEKQSTYTLIEAKRLFPKWYDDRISQGMEPGTWLCNRGLYDWWRRKLKESGNVKVGHRYYCVWALGVFAIKCDIPYDTLKADALELISAFDALADGNDNTNRFSLKDVEAALHVYNSDTTVVKRTTIKAIERLTGIDIKRNKRASVPASRTQRLSEGRARLTELRDAGIVQTGRKPGKSEMRDKVLAWHAMHPNGTPKNCVKDTGISRSTVYRWWPASDKNTYVHCLRKSLGKGELR